jgi:hypothetical protein
MNPLVVILDFQEVQAKIDIYVYLYTYIGKSG